MTRDQVSELIVNIKNYCTTYPISDGWQGEYGISNTKKLELENEFPEFKELMDLLPFICKNELNKSITALVRANEGDEYSESELTMIRIKSTIVSKRFDLIYRQDKDGGVIKENAIQRRVADKVNKDKMSQKEKDDLARLTKGEKKK